MGGLAAMRRLAIAGQDGAENQALLVETVTGIQTIKAMAVELAPGEAQPRIQYADLLLATTGGDSTAITVLTPLVAQRPAYAHARHLLATAHDRLGDKATAVEGYQTFLKLASSNDPARMAVQIRLQAIELGK